MAGGRPRAHARPPPPRGPPRDLVFKPGTASVSPQRAAGRRRVRTVQSVHAEVTKRLAAYRRGEPPPWGPPSRLRRVAGCRPLGMCVPAPAGAARTRPHQALPRPFQAWGPFAEAPAERGAAGCGVRDEPATDRASGARTGRPLKAARSGAPAGGGEAFPKGAVRRAVPASPSLASARGPGLHGPLRTRRARRGPRHLLARSFPLRPLMRHTWRRWPGWGRGGAASSLRRA